MTLDPNNQNQDTTNKEIASMIGSLTRTVQSLSEVLSTHVKSNLETLREIREYIGSQIAYRAYREDIEENRMKLEIEQKNLEIKYKEKLLQEETTESDAMRLERDKLKAELETLKKNLEVVQLVKHSTQEKIKAGGIHSHASSNSNLTHDAKKTIIMTAIAFLTTSFLGGVITIIYFVVKLYITNNP